MASVLTLALLGGYRVALNNQPVHLPTDKTRALLAYLVVEGGRAHDRSVLAGLLWPDMPEATALRNLSLTLARLRQAIPDAAEDQPFFLADRRAVQLNPQSPTQLDVAEFRQRMADGSIAALEQAAALYQGDFLAGFSLPDADGFDDWAVVTREALHRQALDLLDRLAAHYEQRGDYAAAERYARRQLALEPWREEAHRQLMRALASSGGRAEALAQYEACRRILAAELGVEPGPDTRAVYEQIRGGTLAAAPARAPQPEPVHNLPVQLTPFVGREREVAAVRGLIRRADVRLVTLTGPGGTGKTRLAVQVAADVVAEFEHGVHFVNLATLSDPSLVVSTIAATVEVREQPGQPLVESVKQYLRPRQLLLLLDNFEQVVEAAPVVVELLTAAPRLTILVTSREGLHLRGEHEYPVPPLELPPLDASPPRPGYAAPTLPPAAAAGAGGCHSLPYAAGISQYASVQLFVQCASAVKPDFAVTSANASAVAEICHRLDGLPLAIELAAARVKLFPPQQLRQRLDSRLSVLTGGARDLPSRHQTLRNAVAWSYNLLDAGEKTLFRRLAVFIGGCTLDAVEGVCNRAGDLPIDVLDGLTSLVDKSLLRQEEQADGSARFTMLETIREYALERLIEDGEAAAARIWHAEYFVALAEEAEAWLFRAEKVVWLARLATEHDNLRAVLRRALDGGNLELGLRLAGVLWPFWQVGGHISEARRWLRAALNSPHIAQASARARARALYSAGILAFFQGDVTTHRAAATEGLVLAREVGDRRTLGSLLILQAQVDQVAALGLIDEAMHLLRAVGDKAGLGVALLVRGQVLLALGDYAAAEASLDECVTLFQELGDDFYTAQGVNSLGDIARCQGDASRAGRLYAQSLTLFRKIGGQSDIPAVIHNLGYVALAQGEFAHAATLFTESLVLHRSLSNMHGMTEAVTGLACLAAAQGRWRRAATLFGIAEGGIQAGGISLSPPDRMDYERTMGVLRAGVDAETLAAAWAEGRAMPAEAAVAYALAEPPPN